MLSDSFPIAQEEDKSFVATESLPQVFVVQSSNRLLTWLSVCHWQMLFHTRPSCFVTQYTCNSQVPLAVATALATHVETA